MSLSSFVVGVGDDMVLTPSGWPSSVNALLDKMLFLANENG